LPRWSQTSVLLISASQEAGVNHWRLAPLKKKFKVIKPRSVFQLNLWLSASPASVTYQEHKCPGFRNSALNRRQPPNGCVGQSDLMRTGHPKDGSGLTLLVHNFQGHSLKQMSLRSHINLDKRSSLCPHSGIFWSFHSLTAQGSFTYLVDLSQGHKSLL
jgi:hypothetical protein